MKVPEQSCVYIAPVDRIAEVKSELKDIVFEKDNFIVAAGKRQKSYWSQNVWIDAQVKPVESIKKAADFLRQIQRNWWHYPLSSVRRTKLIQETLPRIKAGPCPFPFVLPPSPLGSFALLDEGQMVYSARCASALPNGEFHFEEPPYEAPGLAYLKLWEGLTRLGKWPGAGEYCVDLGSSPGSWTQALLALGAEVLSVDKAALTIPPSPRLEALKKDAFKLDPALVKSPQWVFSDIICYPDKLLELAKHWKQTFPQAHFLFTIKFQGPWDANIVAAFERLPNSTVYHLFSNKHELCWFSPAT